MFRAMAAASSPTIKESRTYASEKIDAAMASRYASPTTRAAFCRDSSTRRFMSGCLLCADHRDAATVAGCVQRDVSRDEPQAPGNDVNQHRARHGPKPRARIPAREARWDR